MPDLTLAQRFGTNVAFNATTKVLSINADLNSIMINSVDYGLNVSAMTDANKDTYASRILCALLLKSQSVQASDNNDETVTVYVTNQGKRSVTRNSVAQFGYQLVATAYKNDTLGVNLDPDAIG
ncbi:MAG TPA: hypothetical protein V6C71_27040 [Coleofasciculaceae cyanobacterium]|jgi:hypothetical protein